MEEWYLDSLRKLEAFRAELAQLREAAAAALVMIEVELPGPEHLGSPERVQAFASVAEKLRSALDRNLNDIPAEEER